MDNILAIPRLETLPAGEWGAIRQSMKAGLRLSFQQSWLTKPESDFEPGYVRLGCFENTFLVYARLRDQEPKNLSARWNEDAWKLGDVIELFLRVDGCRDYYELHVTPENQRLQIRFPESSSASTRKIIPEEWKVDESLFSSIARVNRARSGWEAFLSVDLASLFGREWLSRSFHFLMGRYDYQPGRKLPVLSATAPITIPRFHRLHEWSQARL